MPPLSLDDFPFPVLSGSEIEDRVIVAVPVEESSLINAPTGSDKVTINVFSVLSIIVASAKIVMVFRVSPAENTTLPFGKTAFGKSVSSAGLTPEPETL